MSSDIKQQKQNPNSAASLRTLKPFYHTGNEASESKLLSVVHMLHALFVPLLFLLSRLLKRQRRHANMHVGVIHSQTSWVNSKCLNSPKILIHKLLSSICKNKQSFSKNIMQHPETSKTVWFHAHPVVEDKHANKVDKPP